MTLYTGATDEDTGYVRLTVAYRNLDDCREQFTGSPDRE
jgi:hypothetical protein